MATVRPIESLAELARVESVIAAQFPPRRGTPSHGGHVLRRRFAEDRSLMLVAERDGEIVGGATAENRGFYWRLGFSGGARSCRRRSSVTGAPD
jgi:predicted N-acetyltransferase YhbS